MVIASWLRPSRALVLVAGLGLLVGCDTTRFSPTEVEPAWPAADGVIAGSPVLTTPPVATPEVEAPEPILEPVLAERALEFLPPALHGQVIRSRALGNEPALQALCHGEVRAEGPAILAVLRTVPVSEELAASCARNGVVLAIEVMASYRGGLDPLLGVRGIWLVWNEGVTGSSAPLVIAHLQDRLPLVLREPPYAAHFALSPLARSRNLAARR